MRVYKELTIPRACVCSTHSTCTWASAWVGAASSGPCLGPASPPPAPPGPQATLGLVGRAPPGVCCGGVQRGTPPEAVLHPEGWGWLGQRADSLAPGQARVHGPGGDARRVGFLGLGGNVGWQGMAPCLHPRQELCSESLSLALRKSCLCPDRLHCPILGCNGVTWTGPHSQWVPTRCGAAAGGRWGVALRRPEVPGGDHSTGSAGPLAAPTVGGVLLARGPPLG